MRSSTTPLKDDIVKRSLDRLHDNFVIVLIEKANNIAIID